MEKARCNTELYSNLKAPLNNVKPSNFWGSHHIFIGFFVFANARRHFGNVDKTHSESWPPKPALHEPSAPNHPAPKLQAKRSKRETIRNDMRSFQDKNFAQFQPHSEQNSHIIRSHREHRHPGTTPESTRLSI